MRRKKKTVRTKEGSHIDRVFRLARLLSTRKSGITILSLVDELDVSRASIYRDLKVLERAGFPIASSKVNGEARYSLSPHHAPLPRSRDETLALVLAKIALAPISGTSVYRALSAIANGSRDDGRVVLTATATPPGFLDVIHQAVADERDLSINYQGTGDSVARARVVEPVELRVHAGQAYVVAREKKSSRFKTFKVARVKNASVLDVRNDARRVYASDEVHRHSMGVWSGEVQRVVVRIAPDVARFVAEWPLSRDQVVRELDDGSVEVSAMVAGSMEVLRWVLRWGRNAEVIEPLALREKIEDEIRAMGERYRVVSYR